MGTMGSGGLMEIASFFRLSVRRVVALAVVGLVAAGVAGVVAYRSPAKYQGSALLFTAQVLKPGIPQYSLAPVSDNLLNMVFTSSVVDRAARLSGESPGQVAGNLEAGPAGTNDVQVSYTSTNAAAVPVVLKAVSHEALRVLGRTQLASAEAGRTQAQKDVTKAAAALSAYESAHGTSATTEHEQLSNEVDRTYQALGEANQAVADAQDVLTRASLPSVVAVSGASKQSQVGDVARAAATAGVAAVALLLLVMFVSDWRRSREDELVREARRRVRQGPEPVGEPMNGERERRRGRDSAVKGRSTPDPGRFA
jgi:hypothetical protein